MFANVIIRPQLVFCVLITGSSKAAPWSLQPPALTTTLDSYDDVLTDLQDGANPETLTAVAAQSGSGSSSAGLTEEMVKQLYDTSKTPILMTERKNPVLPRASLTPFKPCLHVDGELTYQGQAVKVAATTMLHDLIQKYIFHPSKCFSFTIRSSLGITRAEKDADKPEATPPNPSQRPHFAFFPEAHDDDYLPRTKTGEVVTPAWVDVPTYPWLSSMLAEQGESEGDELVVSIFGQEQGREGSSEQPLSTDPKVVTDVDNSGGRSTVRQHDVFALTMRLNFQELNEDLLLADKLGLIINAGKK